MKRDSFFANMVILVSMFAGWLAVSYMLFGLVSIGIMGVGVASAVITVVLCLTVLRKATAMLLPWLVEYLCGVNNFLKTKLEKYWLTPGPDGKPHRNAGIGRLGHLVVWLFWILIAAIASAIRPVTTSRTHILFHQFSMFIPRITGEWYERVGFALYLILTVVSLVTVIVLLLQLYQNTLERIQGNPVKYNVPRTAFWVGAYLIGKHVFNYIFFGYGWSLVFQDILFWTGLAIVIAAVFGIYLLINALVTS